MNRKSKKNSSPLIWIGPGCLVKPQLPWAWFRAKETNCSLREKFEFRETAFQQAFAQVELGIFSRHTCLSYRSTPTHAFGPHTCFRPPHLLPVPHLLLAPRLLPAPASTSGPPSASGSRVYFRLGPRSLREAGDCIAKKDALVHHSSLGFADLMCFGARYYGPRSRRVLL